MIFVRRHPASLFDPFFLEPDTDRYFFPHLLLDNKDDEDENQVADRSLTRTGRNVNMTEDDEAWTMYMDMPGVKTQDVEMEENQGVLTVKAVRKTGDKVTARYHQNFTLDPRTTKVDALSADLTDGVLIIKVPKKPAPEPVTVKVIQGDAPEAAEDSNEFRCTMELPGIKAGDLNVEFRDDSLFLQAERKKGNYTSKVQRMFTVGRTVDTKNAKAFLSDGILTFVAPRVETMEPKVHKITLGKATPPTLKSDEEHANE